MEFRIQTHQVFGRPSPNMAFSIIGPKDFLLSVHSVIEHNAHQAVNQNTEGSKIGSLRLLQYQLWFFQIPIYTQAQNVWSGWPVYEVKCLCSRGWE